MNQHLAISDCRLVHSKVLHRSIHCVVSSFLRCYFYAILYNFVLECMGSYGPNCASPCGHCKDGSTCDRLIGTCPNGCDPGWTGLLCANSKLLLACLFGLCQAKNCIRSCAKCIDSRHPAHAQNLFQAFVLHSYIL